MISFIDDQRAVYGVEPICKLLPIAPSTYFLHKARQRDPARRSARASGCRARREDQPHPCRKLFGLWRPQGVATVTTRGRGYGALHGGVSHAGQGFAGRCTRQGRQDNDQRPQDALPAGQGEPHVCRGSTKPFMGCGLHLCRDVGGLRLCRIRHRCLCPADRRLARLSPGEDAIRPRRTRTGARRATACRGRRSRSS
jgi:hypothetical protein